ncbi:hypothetical protein NQ315_011223 [Exocentrus adspersus]|uniref:Ig-like domain-containing protein n=1 Tax=Exocentrus adspersus TaxID=1586481 RepID=A0AAV8VFF6_9CUCU|nr:hypothetical protein NQ315_011223 [Exocentrus adspersus]
MVVAMHKTTLALFILVSVCDGCPFPCICKWKNGKQTAECINKDLVVIPEGIDSSTQVLDFSGNNLRTLHQEKFVKLDLINLQRIYMSRCRISIVNERTFKGLTNLVELDLSDNLLGAIPSAAFLDCPSLMKLTLSRNPIKALEKAAFNHLSFLNTLELSYCQISDVDEGAFQGLFSLEWLHLDGNRMNSFEASKYLPAGLKGLQLQDNPWECDCHLLDLRAWLVNFAFPLSVEPVCSGPLRLSDRTIKSVPVNELACLPDVTPTTFYVEIEQGRNLSLVCQVHAIPEASVTWYFEGQLLQNDTFLAPGVHLLYYIEKGTVEKRSELFIYNANAEDNGTFICNAENPAGSSHANYSIRVILKQELNIDANEVPVEFVLMVTATTAISVLLLLFVSVLSVIKCHRNAKLRRKRDNSKVALRNCTKDNLLQESSEESEHLKENSNIKLVNHKEGLMLYSSHPNEELLRSMSPVVTANQLRSPTSLKCYQEQNPDLINGTESAGRRECDILIENHQLVPKNNTPYNLQTIKEFQEGDCNLCILPTDVRLNPVGLLKTGDDRSQAFSGNYYRTLPYNRNKRQTAAVPIGRFSREAEFLLRTSQPCAYEHYGCDIRYTADGYPVRTSDGSQQATIIPSPPESHKSGSSASTAEPCCSSSRVQWPSCVPAANLHPVKQEATITKKCVGAQTQTECFPPPPAAICNKLPTTVETVNENADEGYEGEC